MVTKGSAIETTVASFLDSQSSKLPECNIEAVLYCIVEALQVFSSFLLNWTPVHRISYKPFYMASEVCCVFSIDDKYIIH